MSKNPAVVLQNTLQLTNLQSDVSMSPSNSAVTNNKNCKRRVFLIQYDH